jgi:hypothetical protein
MAKRHLRGKLLEDYKKLLVLTDIQKDILIGTLLGDASMSLRNGKPHYSVKFEQGEIHAPYIEHLYQIFESFTGSPPEWRFTNKEHTRRALWFRTYRHDQLIFYWNLFYKTKPDQSKVKIVPTNIHQFLTPRALAYWFMDDGSKKENTFVLHTQGFEKHESEKLCEALKRNYNIVSNLHKDKDYWKIYINQQSAETFKDLVKPYVIDCFAYKLN